MAKSKEFKGVFIREVWDFRLSRAAPTLYNAGKTWIVKIHCNKTGDVLAEYDSGIATVNAAGIRNIHDTVAIAACYKWLYSVRDEYGRDNLELRKPVVALINTANIQASQLNVEIINAEGEGDTNLANQKRGELQQHVKTVSKSIKQATVEMNTRITEAVQ